MRYVHKYPSDKIAIVNAVSVFLPSKLGRAKRFLSIRNYDLLNVASLIAYLTRMLVEIHRKLKTTNVVYKVLEDIGQREEIIYSKYSLMTPPSDSQEAQNIRVAHSDNTDNSNDAADESSNRDRVTTSSGTTVSEQNDLVRFLVGPVEGIEAELEPTAILCTASIRKWQHWLVGIESSRIE